MLYFFPNRPLLIDPTNPLVEQYSNDPNWIAELKFNGDRLVLQKHQSPTAWKRFDDFLFANRHKDYLKRFEPCKTLLEELKSLDLPLNTQLDGELLHFKTTDIKFKIVLYDIYVLGSKQIFEPLKTRRNILTDILKDRQYQHLSLSKAYSGGFTSLYTEVIKQKEIEGLVMKNLNGKLVFNTGKSNDVSWQNKIRRPHKNYAF